MKLHQQGNEIIVTELRPMSEVPPGEFVLCLIERSKRFESLIKVPGYEMMNDEDDFLSYDFIDILGWLPMPQYRPGAKHIDKTELYEKLRKLNPRQFGELFETHLKSDVSFDDLVSRLP